MDSVEKAKELVSRFEFTNYMGQSEEYAKQCALVTVDELVKDSTIHFSAFKCDGDRNCFLYMELLISYWERVKQEIEKL